MGLKDTEYLIEALCEKENKPRYRTIFIGSVDDYKNQKGITLSDLYVVYKGTTYSIIGGHNIKGGNFVIDTASGKTFSYNIKFEQIYYKKPRTLKDFNRNVKKCGKHKYCEGGGWYSMRQIYELDGVKYCDMSP